MGYFNNQSSVRTALATLCAFAALLIVSACNQQSAPVAPKAPPPIVEGDHPCVDVFGPWARDQGQYSESDISEIVRGLKQSPSMCRRSSIVNAEITKREQVGAHACSIEIFLPSLALSPPSSILGAKFIARDGFTPIEKDVAMSSDFRYETTLNPRNGKLEDDPSKPVTCEAGGYFSTTAFNHACEQVGSVILADVLLMYEPCEPRMQRVRDQYTRLRMPAN